MQLLQWLSWSGFQNTVGAYDHAAQHKLGLPTHDVLADAPTDSLADLNTKNSASWLRSPQAQLSVSSAPFPTCGASELILSNHVVAINPVDWKIQTTGGLGFNLSYPLILGEDVAGEVLLVGSDLKDRFEVGDRVMAHTVGLGKGSAYGGFQFHPILISETTAKIPDWMTFEEAAVLPLSISTAAAGLFMNASLNLSYPPINSQSPARYNTGKSLLVWGCSSSVGSSVVQLAKAAGYAVIATASPSNNKYCKDLGATHVLDYHSKDIVKDLISVLQGHKVAGAYDAIGSDLTVRQTASILHALGGGKIASVGLAPEVFSDVEVSRVSSGDIVTDEPDVAQEIWGKYVPWALEAGEILPKPEPLVVDLGLGGVQHGLDRQKEGVSAAKVVVKFGFPLRSELK